MEAATVQVPYPKAMADAPTLRQSLLAQFDRCPLACLWWLQHEEGQGWSSPPQARGKLGHRAVAKAVAEMERHDEERISPEHMMAVLYEVLRQDDIDRECRRCGAPDPEHLDSGKLRCTTCDWSGFTNVVPISTEQIAELRMGCLAWAKNQSFSVEHLAALEERLEAPITYPSEYGEIERVLTGTPDCLLFESATATVPDWKFSFGVPPERGISTSGYFQQRFYGRLIMRNYSAIQRVTLREHYVYTGEVREATLLRDDLGEVEQELSALVERFDRTYEQSLWRPQPGSHCSVICPAPSDCPILPKHRREGSITTADEARQAVRELSVAQAIVKRRKEGLESYTQRHGAQPLPVADAKGHREIGHRSTARTERPTRKQLEAELKRAERKGAQPDLNRLYRRRSGTRFDEHAATGQPKPTPEDARLAEELRQSIAARG